MQQKQVMKRDRRRTQRDYTDTLSQVKSSRTTDDVAQLLDRIDRCLTRPMGTSS